MCMHTSQHLLSAVLETDLSLATLSWALTAYPTPSYVELPRSLTAAEITRVQAITHAYAYEGRNVHVEVESLVRDGPNTNHPQVEIHESGRTIGKALPEDYTGGVKRVVVIDGVDRNPQVSDSVNENIDVLTIRFVDVVARTFLLCTTCKFSCCPKRSLWRGAAPAHPAYTFSAGLAYTSTLRQRIIYLQPLQTRCPVVRPWPRNAFCKLWRNANG